MALDQFGEFTAREEARFREQAEAMRAENERKARVIADARPMNARDTFAAAALTGLLAGEDWTEPYDKTVAKETAEMAYGFADAMLAARLVVP